MSQGQTWDHLLWINSGLERNYTQWMMMGSQSCFITDHTPNQYGAQEGGVGI